MLCFNGVCCVCLDGVDIGMCSVMLLFLCYRNNHGFISLKSGQPALLFTEDGFIH